MDDDAVAAEVVELAGVEGLVKIADEVDHEFQGLDALLIWGVGIAQRRFKTLEGDDDIAGRILVGAIRKSRFQSKTK